VAEQTKRGVKVYFSGYPVEGLQVQGRCLSCNEDLSLTSLVKVLTQYRYNDCPGSLLQAWQILILGTTEYFDLLSQPEFEHQVLTHAIRVVKEGDVGITCIKPDIRWGECRIKTLGGTCSGAPSKCNFTKEA